VRKRHLAAAAALTVSTASMIPAAAHADTTASTTIYVGSNSTTCSDAGAGTATAPFCTLQAAVDAALPGDTVLASPGIYSPVTITHSGTAANPISITGISTPRIETTATSTATTAFTFTKVNYVTVSGFSVIYPLTQYAYISGSSHVTVDGVRGQTQNGPAVDTTLPGIEITGDSSSVTVSRNRFNGYNSTAPSIQIDAGSSDDVITTNGIENGTILATDAPNTDVTSNSIIYPGHLGQFAPGVTLAGASTGSYVENNIALPGAAPAASAPAALLEIDSAATAGTTLDYNTLGTGVPGYQWAGHLYPDATAFHTATGQGAHDLAGNPDIYFPAGFALEPYPSEGTVINNADSAAPGELATDLNGNTRINDPLYPDAGVGTHAYYDRGAAQIQPTTATTTITTTASGALGVTATTHDWSSTGYTFDFGDGTPTVDGAYGTAAHTYTHPGTYTITATGTSSATTAPFTDTTTFTTTALGSGNLFDTERSSGGTWWGGWQQGPVNSTDIAQAAITAMPDGSTQAVAVTTHGVLEHTSGHPDGSWQNWGVPKNNAIAASASLAGMPDGSTQIIEITTSGTLEHTVRHANGTWQTTGWGTPAGSTGINQAAITAMPNGDTQLIAVTTSGTLEHNIRHANGTWQGWRTLTQPGVTVTDASLSGMPNGSTQIIEITTSGVLKHDVRNANGSWQASGWGSPAGSTGIAEASITAMPNGSTQFAAVTISGVLEHNVRNANGAWQTTGWGDPAQTDLAVGATSPSIAGLPDGNAQIIEISTN
jgi:hypothetical protein